MPDAPPLRTDSIASPPGKAAAGSDKPGAEAPSPRPSLQGKVLDALRLPVAGARITACPEGGAPCFSAMSDRLGGFLLALDAGTYTVTVLARGFAEATQTVPLRQGAAESREFLLQIEGSRDTVLVVGSAGYQAALTHGGTRTQTALRDQPQSITVVTQELIGDRLMTGIGDVVRFMPGITAHQGENNRDQLVIRGNSSSADFFLDGVRDDAQYYRDLYNLDRVEALMGPNSMIFGRGGGGGVVNRVTKEAGFTPLREIVLQGGSHSHERFAADFDQPLGGKAAFRINALYQNSGSFRDHVGLKRSGINPTLTLAPGNGMKITLGYEKFRDDRVGDRGIPSFRGKPVDVDIATYFGNPDDSRVRARVHVGSAALEHQAGRLNFRNRLLIADYDRGYRNYVPGAVTLDRTLAALSAYSNASRRRNVFDQADVTWSLGTGFIRHALLAGLELGRQHTDNLRNTGYFANGAASILVPLSNPVMRTPAAFRQSPTDAANHVTADVAAAYLQDQVSLSRRVQLVAGLRFDHFDLRVRNNRTGENLRRIDRLVSPRAGIVYKPAATISLYGNYTVSYLPSSGDQFASLTSITRQIKPEKFSNYEFGAKWDASRYLSLTAAAYRLNRKNTRATDPNDPARIVQTGSQRSNGLELTARGRIRRAWDVAGGFALQDAYVASDTTVAQAGARIAQAPRSSISLWNNFQFTARLGGGLGILQRSDMYAAVDNRVVLPGYTRVDAAVHFAVTERVRIQLNVDNLLGTKHYDNADGNNNISPGSPRTLRIALTARL